MLGLGFKKVDLYRQFFFAPKVGSKIGTDYTGIRAHLIEARVGIHKRTRVCGNGENREIGEPFVDQVGA
ncbi:MAG: hypothetical protein BWY80_01284 [Firmicutes bacterium ADurb.Bin456]|nr:MAG: hypothetical protein BWY80_01284 [Firmicutes bacterium ADurb.Bin456]